MDCPKCGGPMWDNRASKKSPKMPDYKCKDKENCDGVIWPPRETKTPTPKAAFGPREPKWTWGQLSVFYERALKIASKHTTALTPKALPADVIAAAATIFIAATREGVKPIAGAKPEPKPEPKPAPKPEPDFSDFPEALTEDEDGSGLPF